MSNALPRLIAITDLTRWSPRHTIEVFRALAENARPRSVALQLRAPGGAAGQLLELGAVLAGIARAEEQWLIVNDRLDLAALLEADAVHLGEASVSVVEARALLGARPVFRACHEPRAVTGIGADALVLSPIAAARKGAPPLGVSALSLAARRLADAGEPTRVYALGGVTPESARECLAAGAAGVAAMAGIFGEPAPERWLDALALRR